MNWGCFGGDTVEDLYRVKGILKRKDYYSWKFFTGNTQSCKFVISRPKLGVVEQQ